MSASRPAPRGDSIRVDAQPGGFFANVADGALGVLDALDGLYLLPAGDAIIGGHRDHSARGEVFAMLLKLCRRAVGPAATKEEHDRRSLIRRLVAGRIVDVEVQLRVADC